MSVRKIKGSWWVDFTWNFERLRKRSPLNTRGGAQEYELHLRGLIAEKGSVEAALNALDPRKRARVLTFAEFAEQWMRDYAAVNNKPSTVYTKTCFLRAHLLPAFGRLPITDLTTVLVERYKASKKAEGLVAKTINNHLTVLRRCLATAVEWNLLATVPRIKQLKMIVPPTRFLEPDQVDVLLSATLPSQLGVMILLAVRTGLRYCELAALHWEDVDLSRSNLCVRWAEVRGVLGTPKNDRVRHVPLVPELVEALRTLPRSSARVFPSRTGAGQPYDRARDALRRACVQAGLAPVSWHVFRHSFASHLVLNNAPIKVVQELMGHATLEMTLRYLHLGRGSARSVVDLLPKHKNTAAGGQPAAENAPESRLAPPSDSQDLA